MKTMIVLLFTLFIAAGAKAQYSGPGSEIRLYTVKEIKDDAIQLDRKDVLVRVKGFIVEKLNDEDYIFMDSTGKIPIELEDKYLPDFPFDDKTEIIITAEVDYDMLNGTELEVEKVIERAAKVPEN